MTASRPLPNLSPALEAELVDAMADVILAHLRRIHGATVVPPSGHARAEKPPEPVGLTDPEPA